jgi:uncharacterized protein YyaL (SSP411 family)
LVEQLEERVTARHPDTPPRTHHLTDEGMPDFTNRLALEASPYLLQHAHNPVNWFPWGEEAFEMARDLDRPIFLSVGYSTCHWCHVMEEESFEDVAIATFLNENFIAIKVDREQRPDVDDIYMTAVNILHGRGGWPMTVIMTPDGEPFFGATYIPPRTGSRGSRQGLIEILVEHAERYQDEEGREELIAEAVNTSRRIARSVASVRPGDVPGPEVIEAAVERYWARFDSEHGGFSGRTKFPTPSIYTMLLRYHRRTGDANALTMLTTTLEHMAHGGIYDQVGGGFHRYSTERRWLIPHFEKMLYDNGQLVSLYLEAYQVTGNEEFSRIARETLDYVAREMTAPEGGFYSATDADSEGEEGLFFLWTPEQIREVVGTETARLVESHWGVTRRGNFERSTTILSVVRPLSVVAESLGMTLEAAQATLDEARGQLYDAREGRIHPGLDDKILTSWNGLMIGAFARGALVLGDARYAELAERAAAFIFDNMLVDGRLLRSYLDGNAQTTAYLDDYAFLISGLLDLYEATGNPEWLTRSIELQGVLDEHFFDERDGGYWFTADDAEELLGRQKPAYDGAEPTGNSVAVENLLRLSEFTTEHAYRERAERVFAGFSSVLTRSPSSLTRMVAALDFYLDRPRELVFVMPESGGDLEPFLAQLRGTFLPNRVIVRVREGPELTALQEVVPLVQFKVAQGGVTTAYVCEAGMCERPTSDPETFAAQIRNVHPYESE